MTYWNAQIECMDRETLSQVQLEGLQATLNRVYKNVRHYRKLFRGIDFMPEDLTSLDMLQQLPLLTRRDLSRNYPYDMFAVPLREVVRLHTTAFNFEQPVVIGFTANDMANWAELTARNLAGIGVTREDVVQIALTFGIMSGPFGIQLGAEVIGASVIPISAGKLREQVKIMRDFKTSVLISTPTVALGLIIAMEELDMDPHGLTLKYGVFGAEPWGEKTRQEIESRLFISASDTYGLTEVFGPGVAWECPAKKGLHIAEDHFIAEVIDPATGEVLPPGEEGELVITTIGKEAFPLIRFRTGDLTRMDRTPCSCGRTHCRISRIFKRCDDVLVVRGTSVTPDQIGRILARVSGEEPRFQMVVDREENRDQLMVAIEATDTYFFDEMKKQRRFVEHLHREISEFMGWEVNIRLVEPGTFDPYQKVVDNRRFE
ncbi:MAG: phenylacetate--CoA ligase [Desulfobacterales bacterium]|nr:phenylacetate--CoA ligase [Desulfobacterales bacterium]MBS3754589.1 phenylacetate--CoA ligase [Desulfobacterales bacterium]